MGRPPKAAGEVRTIIVQFRVNDAEQTLLKRAARGRQFARWIRDTLLQAAGLKSDGDKR
jgi:hypothetical protein